MPPALKGGIDPAAVLEAKAGKREEVNLGWWPNLFPDATEALQEALDSNARKVIIPNLGKPYTVKPIQIRRSDLEIVFEPGVEIRAERGKAYENTRACLFTVRNVKNVAIRGNGATLRMNKREYPREPHSEWRHGIKIEGCEDVVVEALTIRETGGDGVYISYLPTRRLTPEDIRQGDEKDILQSRNITIRNVRSLANHRQGLSIISGENILVERCTFEKTAGTPPASGVDIEPGNERCILKNIVLRDCVARDNAGSGFLVYLAHLKKNSEPVSVRLENCKVDGGVWGLIAAAVDEDNGVRGSVVFKQCTVKGTKRGGLYVYDKAASGAEVIFDECSLEDVATQQAPTAKTPDEVAGTAVSGRMPPPNAPIVFYLRRRPQLLEVDTFGGVKFLRCTVKDAADRPLIASGAATEPFEYPIAAVTGELLDGEGVVTDVAQFLASPTSEEKP